MDAKGESTTTF